MCVDLNKKVSAIVNEWTGKGFLFSAHDVTKKMRHSGESVRHAEVRDEVRNMHANGEIGSNYSRSLLSVYCNGKTDSTYVYHSMNSDPMTYQPDWFTKNPTQDNLRYDAGVKTLPASSVSSTLPSQFNNNTMVCMKELTSENRLNISSRLLTMMGVKSGDSVFAQESGSKIVIVNGNSSGGYDDIEYEVDYDNRIRLSARTLSKVFGDVSKIVNFLTSYNATKNCIEVEKV